jgi:hypothetical protein
MTEVDWLTSTDSHALLAFVRLRQASGRKLRLFACACCRAVWPLLLEEETRHAIEVSEAFADALLSADALNAAAAVVSRRNLDAWAALWQPGVTQADRERHLRTGAAWDATGDPVRPEGVAVKLAALLGDHAGTGPAGARHCVLLRELFSNPFRSFFVDPAWLTWSDGTVRGLAQAIYDERSFDRLPILGDALEDAGCADTELLAHCRGAGLHVRGCWALDLLLGRQ